MKRCHFHEVGPILLLVFACACHSSNPENLSSGGYRIMLNVPNEPDTPSPDKVMVDEPFLQEFNHTMNEPPGQIGELVALVMPPQAYSDFDRPTLVAPRGLWRQDAAGWPGLLEIPPEASDITDAETAGGAIHLMTADTLYRVGADSVIEFVADLPDGALPFRLVGTDEGLYILTSVAIGWCAKSGDPVWYSLDPAPAALHRSDDSVFLAWPGSLAAYPIDTAFEPADEQWRVDIDVGTPAAILTNRTLPRDLDLVVVGSDGSAGYSLVSTPAFLQDVPLFDDSRTPLAGAVAAIEDSNGGFIVAAAGGAYRIVAQEVGPEYRVYVPDRWMPHSDVRDLLEDTSEKDGPLYFATRKGLGSVTRSTWTLADKIETMIERIALRHDRDGAVADSRLAAPGDLSTSIPWDSDNDGGWTCYWVLSECFRYRLTGDEEARAHFDRSLERMLSFRTLSGTDHFLARSIIRIDGCRLDDCDDPDDGEWFLSPDGEWWVKADTSNDEVTSHMFMMGHAYDLCADEEQKQAIVEHVDGIIGGIIDNGYRLIDPQDNECTSHGQFDPHYVNRSISGTFADGGRRSAQMLGAINLAYYLTGKRKYLEAKRELIGEHHYDRNVMSIGDVFQYPFCAGSGDCDELAFQAFVPLVRYEWDPVLREKWMTGWRRLYKHLIDQEDAFWDVANAVFEGENIDFFHSKRWYRRYPTDLVRWVIHNEARIDAVPPPLYYLVKEPQADYRVRSDGHIFPADERPNQRHNTPQFRFSGGWSPLREMDGGDALFPYWYGRYYGFIAGS